MSVFYLYQDKKNNFRFRLLNENRECLLESEPFTVKQGCISAIVSCKLHAPYDKNYQRLKAGENAYYFNLRARNLTIIGRSLDQETKSLREHMVDAVKKHAELATVEDHTD